MIEQVEEFRPELNICMLEGMEPLKDREIHIVVTRPVHLVPGPTEGTDISLPNCCCSRRLHEPCCIQERRNPVRAFVSVCAHSLRKRGVALEIPTHCADWTPDCERKAIL